MTLADFFSDLTSAIAAFLPDWQVIVLAAVVLFAAARALRALRVVGR